ncbi:MAG: glutamyl-tRNA amidotransferase [Clostridia bacterium]|nr:glutamyl-tRNA amidotransferase [Clostridia bacterium]MBR0443880.1 glutamyl-tRNA amidotransferase [Clostridia bacterium]
MDNVLFAVNGTLMRGLELEDNLIRAGARFVREDRTAGCYRLYSIDDAYPAMIRTRPDDPDAGKIALEVWSLPPQGLAEVFSGEPAGLCIGRVFLENGETVCGMLGEPELVRGKKEITAYGGWRAYTARNA